MLKGKGSIFTELSSISNAVFPVVAATVAHQHCRRCCCCCCSLLLLLLLPMAYQKAIPRFGRSNRECSAKSPLDAASGYAKPLMFAFFTGPLLDRGQAVSVKGCLGVYTRPIARRRIANTNTDRNCCFRLLVLLSVGHIFDQQA